MLKQNYLYVVFVGIFLFISCDKNDVNNLNDPLEESLVLIESYEINVLEPSGLTIDITDSVLYTVSDNTGDIYKLSLKGSILKKYSYGGDDLEGITLYKESKLLLAEERLKQLVEYDINTGNVVRHYVNYENNSTNSGIEGVAYKANDGTTFILNEKDPAKMFRLRGDFSVLGEYDLNFASDYSGLFYDITTNNLWIVSDQSKTLNRCTLMGKLIKKYSIDVNQAEGVAVTNDRVYIVSDLESRLYIYEIPKE